MKKKQHTLTFIQLHGLLQACNQYLTSNPIERLLLEDSNRVCVHFVIEGIRERVNKKLVAMQLNIINETKILFDERELHTIKRMLATYEHTSSGLDEVLMLCDKQIVFVN